MFHRVRKGGFPKENMSCRVCILAFCRSEVFPNIGNGAVKPISPLIGKTSTAIQTDASQTLASLTMVYLNTTVHIEQKRHPY